MKKIFHIFFLLAMICKIVEPSVLALHFEESSDANSLAINDEESRTIKIYHPMPYHANTDEDKDVSKLYQEGEVFYHIIEQRFERDTFYIKIQNNSSARDRFFALANAVSDIQFDKNAQKSEKSSLKHIFSLDDISKVFSPSKSPLIVSETWHFHEGSYQQYSVESLSFSNPFLSIVAPPPDTFLI